MSHAGQSHAIRVSKSLYGTSGHPDVEMAQSSQWIRRTRFLAMVVLLGTVVLLVLLIAIPLIVPHESLPEPIVVFWGIFILIAALIAGLAAAYLFLGQAQLGMSTVPAAAPETNSTPPTADAGVPELSDLAIRLLDGDEQRLMRMIVEAKGTILQRDLVRITTFSDAKVSRLLDRLERRGLIIRERHGMTNRVRLTLHEA